MLEKKKKGVYWQMEKIKLLKQLILRLTTGENLLCCLQKWSFHLMFLETFQTELPARPALLVLLIVKVVFHSLCSLSFYPENLPWRLGGQSLLLSGNKVFWSYKTLLNMFSICRADLRVLYHFPNVHLQDE